MKKKFLLLVLAMTLSLSSLVGCGGSDTKKGNTETQQEEKENTDDTQVENNNEGENNTETEAPDDSSSEAETENKEEDNTPVSTTPPVTTVEATLENPAKFGEWIQIMDYAPHGEIYHPVYFRVTGMIRGEEAQAVVDAYNEEDHFSYFEPLEDDNLEFCVFTYEVLFPEDYPQGDYGISTCALSNLGISNLKGSGAIANYIGLSMAYDVSTEPDEFFSGQTFTDGKAVFAMVKDFNEFLIDCTYYDNNDESHTVYISIQ